MATDFKLPELGENIKSGTVTKILVKTGDSLKKGQNILELETDKAVLEVPSTQDGVVAEILVKTGDTIKVGQAILKLNSNVETPLMASLPNDKKSPSATAQQAASSSPAQTVEKSVTPQSSAAAQSIEWKIPALGENIKGGTVTKINVKPGDAVKKGQSLFEIETDKAVLEVPSEHDGVVEEVLIKSGSAVKVGQAALKIKTSGGAATPTPAKSESKPNVETQNIASLPKESPASAATKISQPVPESKPAKEVPAAPSVRRFAREIGIDISQVPGTGPGGRISIEDVKAYAKQLNSGRATSGGGGALPAIALPDFSRFGETERKPMNNVRKKTAEHLSAAWITIPHVTQFDKADVTELEKLRKKYSTKDRKLTVTAFLLKVVAAALKQYPQFNSSVDMATSEIVYKKFINIGVAVDTDRGLLVPNIKNVDQKTILQLATELNEIAERARNRKTSLEEMAGGCFTITNLGGIGGTHFTPIVNAPEVAILGVSRGQLEPVYQDGQFIPRVMLPFSLSYDHRVIDGADGARFLRWICEAIEQPFLMDLNG